MIAPLHEISAPTRLLSEYIAGALARALPDAVVEKARHHILDTLAAMVSGTELTPGRLALGYAAAQGGAPEASIVGTRQRASAVNAALRSEERRVGKEWRCRGQREQEEEQVQGDRET